jgi:hypothetical protein
VRNPTEGLLREAAGKDKGWSSDSPKKAEAPINMSGFK